jgi:hypothetical protein
MIGATRNASAYAECAGGRLMLVMFGFVKFEQQSHMFKASINSVDNAFFKLIQTLTRSRYGFIDALIGVDRGRDRADYAKHREGDPDDYCQNLYVGQLISPAG